MTKPLHINLGDPDPSLLNASAGVVAVLDAQVRCVAQVKSAVGVPIEVSPFGRFRLYERLITQDKVDVVLGPYSSAINFNREDDENGHVSVLRISSRSSVPTV
jgi:hypothetical protein